jgi:hypothetical protein
MYMLCVVLMAMARVCTAPMPQAQCDATLHLWSLQAIAWVQRQPAERVHALGACVPA